MLFTGQHLKFTQVSTTITIMASVYKFRIKILMSKILFFSLIIVLELSVFKSTPSFGEMLVDGLSQSEERDSSTSDVAGDKNFAIINSTEHSAYLKFYSLAEHLESCCLPVISQTYFARAPPNFPFVKR